MQEEKQRVLIFCLILFTFKNKTGRGIMGRGDFEVPSTIWLIKNFLLNTNMKNNWYSYKKPIFKPI